MIAHDAEPPPDLGLRSKLLACVVVPQLCGGLCSDATTERTTDTMQTIWGMFSR